MIWQRRVRIAVQDSFPNRPHTAEAEFVKRLALCAGRSGADIRRVACSEDILASGADFVLSLHEVSPKLTPVPTLGVMWNPPSGIRRDPTRCDFVGSYDAYLPASRAIERFIAERNAAFAGPAKPVADFRFFPTAPARIAQAASFDSLAYLGVHWDGDRHGDLLRSLAADGSVALYGPEAAWRHAGSAYRGTIPFDGTSVIRRLAEHGIALCLHRDSHIAEDTPSMRLFEAASAGCLILCDALPFARETFGDSVFVLPEADGRADFIRRTLAWARANPRKARDMARTSQAIFERHCSLDALLPRVVRFGRAVAGLRRPRWGRPKAWPRIDVFVPVIDPGAGTIARAVTAVNAQTHRAIRLVVLRRRDSTDDASGSPAPRPGVEVIQVTACDASGSALPPEALAAHMASDFVTALADDQSWAPEHLARLISALDAANGAEAAASSLVLIARQGERLTAPNLSGDLDRVIPEDRALARSAGAAPTEWWDGASLRTGELGHWLLRASLLRRLAARGAIPADGACAQSGRVTAFRRGVAAAEIEPVEFA